jgi:hypothetical protein
MSAAEATALMLADLARSGLSERDARRAGYETVNGRGNGPCYRLPYFGLDGEPYLHGGEQFARTRLLGPADLERPRYLCSGSIVKRSPVVPSS